MPSNSQDINSYAFSNSDRLLLDANVWMFVHGPNRPGDNRVAVYSGALAKILAANSTIHTDVLIISEFINRYARLRHGILQSTAGAPADFKQFRNSADFKPVAQEIAGAGASPTRRQPGARRRNLGKLPPPPWLGRISKDRKQAQSARD